MRFLVLLITLWRVALFKSGIWNDSVIIFNLNALELGTYRYLIVVYDSSGNSASDAALAFVVEAPSTFIPLDYTLVISIGSIVVIIVIVGVICRTRGQGSPASPGYDW